MTVSKRYSKETIMAGLEQGGSARVEARVGGEPEWEQHLPAQPSRAVTGAGRAALARSEGGRLPSCCTGVLHDAGVLGDRDVHLELKAEPAAAPASGPILLVEDEEALAGTICYRLQREGFEA